MKALTKLTQECFSEDPSPERIATADGALQNELEERTSKNHQCISSHINTGHVSKSESYGFDLYVFRHGQESNEDWAIRTRQIAGKISTASDRRIDIEQETFESGAIHMSIRPGSAAYQLFQDAAEAQVQINAHTYG